MVRRLANNTMKIILLTLTLIHLALEADLAAIRPDNKQLTVLKRTGEDSTSGQLIWILLFLVSLLVALVSTVHFTEEQIQESGGSDENTVENLRKRGLIQQPWTKKPKFSLTADPLRSEMRREFLDKMPMKDLARINREEDVQTVLVYVIGGIFFVIVMFILWAIFR